MSVCFASPVRTLVWTMAAVIPLIAALASAHAGTPVDERARHEVVETILKQLNENYVFPDVARETEEAVRERIARKEYAAITDPAELAVKLTADLQAVSRDKHLRVNHSEPNATEKKEPVRPQVQGDAAEHNGGFTRVERLPGNIGYIDLRMFFPRGLVEEKAAAAMNLVADTHSLIIDLRQNGGGDPQTVALMVSYLIDGAREPFHLNSFVGRDGKPVEEFWTSKDLPGKRYAGKDVYVLTSANTFSAAEEFAYDVQNLNRATIVGEVTGGGANPVNTFRVGRGFRVGIPIGRAMNPITKTNWEGVGVKPTVAVPAAAALQTAHLAALDRRIAETTAEPEKKKRLESAAEQVRRELDQVKQTRG